MHVDNKPRHSGGIINRENFCVYQNMEFITCAKKNALSVIKTGKKQTAKIY